MAKRHGAFGSRGGGVGGASSHAGRGRDDYWWLSARPLHGLVFLLPLVLLYELGSLLYLTDVKAGIQQTIRAKKLLDVFFSTFGVAGLLVTGVAMLVVLLTWHILSRDKWQVRPVVLLGMAMEAALWALPLVVFGAIFQRATAVIERAAVWAGESMPACLAMADGGANGLMALAWPARATVAIGAGIYEELLFRLVGIALLHFIVADVLQAGNRLAQIVAVGGSALAFAFYHDVSLAGGGIAWAPLGFYFVAGVYFGLIYLWRGFGIVVAAHAVYDLIALVILPAHG